MKNFALLKGLDDEQLAQVAAVMRPIEVKPGDVVVREGDSGDDFFLIEEGELEVLKSGEDISVANLGPGRDFGAMALLGQGARTATIRAVAPTKLFSLSIEELRKVDGGADGRATAVMLRNILASHMSYLERVSDRTVSALRKELEESRAKVSFGSFLTYLVGLMCLYGYILKAAAHYIEETHESTPITVGLLLVYAGSLFLMVRRSGYPDSAYGLTLEGWKRDLRQTLIWTGGFIAVVTLLKLAVLEFVPGMGDQPLFSLRGFKQYTPMKSLSIAVMYSIFAPAQEFVARGALQASFQQFLSGRWVTARAIVLSTLLFGTTHLHMSTGYAIVAIVPSIFWGMLFARQKSLFGVSLSHVLIGLYVAFFLGVPGMSTGGR